MFEGWVNSAIVRDGTVNVVLVVAVLSSLVPYLPWFLGVYTYQPWYFPTQYTQSIYHTPGT